MTKEEIKFRLFRYRRNLEAIWLEVVPYVKTEGGADVRQSYEQLAINGIFVSALALTRKISRVMRYIERPNTSESRAYALLRCIERRVLGFTNTFYGVLRVEIVNNWIRELRRVWIA